MTPNRNAAAIVRELERTMNECLQNYNANYAAQVQAGADGHPTHAERYRMLAQSNIATALEIKRIIELVTD